MMTKISSLALALTLAAGIAVSGVEAADKNPIFGGAKVTTLSKVENAKVAGKGYYADYYGYYGNLYTSYAAYYGDYAYNYAGSNTLNEYNNYYLAYYYAGQAYTSYYYAYYYSYTGY
jgi:hypothetical protein